MVEYNLKIFLEGFLVLFSIVLLDVVIKTYIFEKDRKDKLFYRKVCFVIVLFCLMNISELIDSLVEGFFKQLFDFFSVLFEVLSFWLLALIFKKRIEK